MQRVSTFFVMLFCGLSVALASTPAPAAEGDSTLDALVELLAKSDDAEFQLDVLRGMRAGLQGRKDLKMPRGWPAANAKLQQSQAGEVRDEAQLLALAFNDPQAIESLRTRMLSESAAPAERQAALQALVEKRVADLAPLLHKLLDDRPIRAAALRGLAAYDAEQTPQLIVARYRKLATGEKQDAIGTLVARPAYAAALLEAMEAGTVDRNDVSAFTARQIQNLGDEKLAERLEQVWGVLRQTSAEKKALMAKLKQQLPPDVVAKADLSAGRAVYARTCQQCHKLFGEGAGIGPDLTGSNRANLDYVLENAIDPSAIIGRDYRLTNVVTDDGRLISGILLEETEQAVVLQTVNERIVVSKADVESMAPSPISMMPDGQLEKMSQAELRDLVGYLGAKEQVPLPEGFELPKEPVGK